MRNKRGLQPAEFGTRVPNLLCGFLAEGADLDRGRLYVLDEVDETADLVRSFGRTRFGLGGIYPRRGEV